MLCILLTIVIVCGAQDDAFLTHSLFNTLLNSCQEFYSANNIQIGDDHYKLFTQNVEEIEALSNNNDNTYEAGVNCFTALSDDERLQWLGASVPEGLESSVVLEQSNIGAPEKYDRRDDNTTTAARNQRSCGSCWAFSSVAVLESAYLVLAGGDPLDIDFSEQQVLDCTYERQSKDGCRGGWMTDAWNTLRTDQNNILVSEASLPYTGVDNTCNIKYLKNAMTKVKIIDSGNKRYFSDDEFARPMANKTAGLIWSKSAISVAIRVEKPFFSYKTGIFNTQCVYTTINHAVTLVGYTTGYFIAKNSWGTTWGETGHVKISRIDGNLCRVYHYIMYPSIECRYGVGGNGKCNAEPECSCTKRCKHGKVCFRKPDKNNKMGCRCPSNKYGSKCQYLIDCTKENKKCERKHKNWSKSKWTFKCLKKFGAKKCPRSCGRCG